MKYRSKANETRERSGQMEEAEQTRYGNKAGEVQKRGGRDPGAKKADEGSGTDEI